MHYLLQITLEELEAATLPRHPTLEDPEWGKQWNPHGGTKYVGHYASGMAAISGPIQVGNPAKPWFEVQASHLDVITALSAIAVESMEMHEAVTSRGPMRAAYKAKGRRVLRNETGNPIGVMCTFEICGSGARQSSLGGREPEEMPELEGLD